MSSTRRWGPQQATGVEVSIVRPTADATAPEVPQTERVRMVAHMVAQLAAAVPAEPSNGHPPVLLNQLSIGTISSSATQTVRR